ncbi:uncharacterized protein Bfra_000620, partial [Botrytis fragariae]
CSQPSVTIIIQYNGGLRAPRITEHVKRTVTQSCQQCSGSNVRKVAISAIEQELSSQFNIMETSMERTHWKIKYNSNYPIIHNQHQAQTTTPKKTHNRNEQGTIDGNYAD